MTPPRRWIRLDVGWEQSEWLDTLDGHAAGCWPRFLCYMKLNGIGGRAKAAATPVLARLWRVDPADVDRLMAAAYAHGSVVLEGSNWFIPKWAEYQEPDRTAAERQRRHRADRSRFSPLRRDTVTDRDQGVTEGVGHGVTRHATETLTETEKKNSTRVRRRVDVTPEFLALWKIHPRGSRASAFEHYRKALADGEVTHDQLVTSLGRYRAAEISDRFHGHDLFRWLRDGRWEEYLNGSNGNGRPAGKGERWRPGVLRLDPT